MRRPHPGPVVLILAKAPEPGRVKTRLCPPLAPDQAAELAAAALLDSMAAAAAVPGGHAAVVLTGDLRFAARGVELQALLHDMTVLPQRGDGLGARIVAAHLDVAALLPGHRTLQIGMDTPQVGPLLAEADATLCTGRVGRRAVDAVLGLAADGGWWALGLRDPTVVTLIADVPTSVADTGERTLAALRDGGLRVALLPELSDVDTAADAVAVAAEAPHTRFAAAVRALPADTLPPPVPQPAPAPARRLEWAG
ncbi:MAG: TIGR04282 family arsenosugar biosynthesis glycosyltransferase [Pseudonocardia sp.]